MASQRDIEDLLAALDAAPNVPELQQSLETATSVDDLLRALDGAPSNCSRHILHFLQRLDALSVGARELKRLGERASPILMEAVSAARNSVDVAREEMRHCPDCWRAYQALKAAAAADR